MRDAAGPTTASKTQLKRESHDILKGRQRCVLNFPWVGKVDDVIHMRVDADWAGDPKTRCSTSGGVLAIGPCFTVRHWSVTQATVSLSSASSKAKAMTKCCIEAFVCETSVSVSGCGTTQNCILDRQQQRQGHHAASWTRVQSKNTRKYRRCGFINL